MARDEVTCFVNKTRHGPSKRANTGGDLGDLGIGVRPGVARVGNERGNRAPLDMVGRPCVHTVNIVVRNRINLISQGHLGVLAGHHLQSSDQAIFCTNVYSGDRASLLHHVVDGTP
jgi:hypothetical protein